MSGVEQLRAWTLCMMRYHLLVDCMPTDGLPQLSAQAVARISQLALAAGRLTDQLLPCKLLVVEVRVCVCEPFPLPPELNPSWTNCCRASWWWWRCVCVNLPLAP
jgi:hypothetical protein